MTTFTNALLAATALACACAVLSIVVVLRRWAFIGEGIGHSGFGGAGTAWLAALVFPAFDTAGATYAFVIVFCLLTALAIGLLSRSERVNADAAIGIFLVASLAWGFAAQQIYLQQKHTTPYGFETYLFGQIRSFEPRFALSAIAVSAAVLITALLLWKQIIAYSFDPLMAQTSGVRAGFVHYLLMLLIGLVIVIGVRVAGSVLITALLVLPGSTALAISRRMRTVVIVAMLASLVGAVGGLLLSLKWSYIPLGPSIVLILFIEFVAAFVIGAARRAT
jgi:ABC-type Mn2+/Zn2+ transport system permease subunit